MKIPDSKRVSLIELFYDLVFVYMIAQATGLIHHLHHGVVEPISLVVFFFVIIVFINAWMVQTVFTNRFGTSSWGDVGFAFIDMAIVLYMSNTFSGSTHYDLRPFFIAAGLLSVTLVMQYASVAIRSTVAADRAIAKIFLIILSFRAITLLLGGLLPQSIGTPIAALGIIISWIAPGFTGKYTSHHPIIFSHLLERLTLLTIITFGETIVGIADYFTKETLSWTSILIFAIVCGLFFSYITEFDHLIEEHRTGETGNLLIYLHYPIIFGLSLITVALTFISEPEASHWFAVSVLYAGIGLFLLGIAVAAHYNPNNRTFTRTNWLIFGFCTVVGYVISLSLYATFAVALTTTIAVGLCCVSLVRKIKQD